MIGGDLQAADHGEGLILCGSVRHVVGRAAISRVGLRLPLWTAAPPGIGAGNQRIIRGVDKIRRVGAGLLQGVRANRRVGPRPAQRVLAVRVRFAVVILQREHRHAAHILAAVREDFGGNRRGRRLARHRAVGRYPFQRGHNKTQRLG